MLDDSNLNSVLALAGLSFPAEFIEAMRAYRDQDRLARLGLMRSPHEIAEFVQPSFSEWPFWGEGFLPFMQSNSNYVFVGCGRRDQGIIVQADQKIEELLQGDPSVAWWYLPGASEELCKGLLEVNDFHMQEAAALRLGRFGSVSALEPLHNLANTVVPRGHVNQHVETAKRAVE